MIYEVYLDGACLYYPGDEINTLTSAVLERKLNQAGAFKITVPFNNPCFQSFKQRQSEICVLKDGVEIWNGEVLDIGGNIKNQKSVYAVGELSYLNASSQPQKAYHLTPAGMLSILLQEHNAMVEPRKQFELGMVTVSNEFYNWITNYEKTLDYIRTEICDKLNGYLRIRKVDGKRYLDLVRLEDYGKSCSQTIEFGENLLDYTSDITVDEIVTVVRPLGVRLETSEIEGVEAYLTIESVNDGKDYLENTDAINSGIGKIWETVHFNVLNDASAVKKAGKSYLKDRQFAKMNITATAIDLSELDADIESFEMGDSVNIVATPFGLDKWSYITEKTVDLLNPSTKYNVTIGETVKKTYTQQVTIVQEEIKTNAAKQNLFLLELAKKNASEIIKNASEGNIHFVYDENGKPKELLIMDTDDINTAKKVWRFNLNGLGYSSTGYNGKFGLAITMDGQIVGDYIFGGTMSTTNFHVVGTVTKYASDYTQEDLERANKISLGIIEPTSEDYEKYDLNADGIIDSQDLIIIDKFLDGELESKTFNTSVRISAGNEKEVIKLQNVSIGANTVRAKNVTGENIFGKMYHVQRPDGTWVQSNITQDIFETADGKKVTVVGGIITDILSPEEEVLEE